MKKRVLDKVLEEVYDIIFGRRLLLVIVPGGAGYRSRKTCHFFDNIFFAEFFLNTQQSRNELSQFRHRLIFLSYHL